MIDINDDLGLAKEPFRVIACLAVYGRRPLLEHTIRRLYQKNGCEKVICVGDVPEDKKLCESLGAVWVQYKNRFLGDKWNQAFLKAKEYNPEACLFVGSSDWVCDAWISLMRPYVEQYGFAGTPGCYLADVGDNMRLVHWPGYESCRPERATETIGIGRMLSRRLLDAIGWAPFSPILKNSLDKSMKDGAVNKGFTDFMVHDERLLSLSLSTAAWTPLEQNKHKFWMHWDGRIPSKRMLPEPFLSNHFPEIYQIFKPNEIQNNNHKTESDQRSETNGMQCMSV